jgi:hypothetical protein
MMIGECTVTFAGFWPKGFMRKRALRVEGDAGEQVGVGRIFTDEEE